MIKSLIDHGAKVLTRVRLKAAEGPGAAFAILVTALVIVAADECLIDCKANVLPRVKRAE